MNTTIYPRKTLLLEGEKPSHISLIYRLDEQILDTIEETLLLLNATNNADAERETTTTKD